MKKTIFLRAALSMTAALMMTACSNDDENANGSPAQQNVTKTIPYTVTVNGDGSRASVDSDNKTLRFAAGDKLYISSDSRDDLKGELTLKSGDEGKTSGATFEGTLTYTGDAPADELTIKATLVGTSNVGVQITDGKVTGMNYPSAAYCSDVNDAVQKYSNLTGISNYGAKSFSLSQQTAFLNFVITFEDATTTGTELSAVVSNNSATVCTADVTTVTENEKVVAKFVLPVAKGTTLSSANVQMGGKTVISFGDSQTLDGKVYNVKRTQAAAVGHELSASVLGDVVGTDGQAYAVVDRNNLPTGVTAVAVVAYKSGDHGLAIALADESGTMNRSTAISTCASKGASWTLPSKDQWEDMLEAKGGEKYSYTSLNTKITTAGGTALIEDKYWTSYHYNTGNPMAIDCYVYMKLDGDASFEIDTGNANNTYHVRACLSF